tara:strand:- start:26 stop:148 length:123 start_codon:yes stop_codon:yes gene_type:complete
MKANCHLIFGWSIGREGGLRDLAKTPMLMVEGENPTSGSA